MYRILKLNESAKLKESNTDNWEKFRCPKRGHFTPTIMGNLETSEFKGIGTYIQDFISQHHKLTKEEKEQFKKFANDEVLVKYKNNKLESIVLLDESAKLNENKTEEYWDAKELIRDNFMSLMKFNFGSDSKGNNYIITVDANDIKRFHANDDNEAKKIYDDFKKDWNNSDHGDLTANVKGIAPRNESAKLTEADEEDLEDKIEDLEKAEDIEDNQEETLDSEEDQEENPAEEESTLDTQLDELRDILVDLDDIRLYKIVSKDNEEFYILGKVANDSNDVEMLVDTQPIDYENKEDSKETQEINPEEIDQKYQFVSLPLKFDMIKDMNPKYGEDLNPNHEELVSYLMNLLVEQNPEAVEEQREEIEEPKDEELPEVPEEINSEEEDEDEEV